MENQVELQYKEITEKQSHGKLIENPCKSAHVSVLSEKERN
jgi:hypothetical protein